MARRAAATAKKEEKRLPRQGDIVYYVCRVQRRDGIFFEVRPAVVTKIHYEVSDVVNLRVFWDARDPKENREDTIPDVRFASGELGDETVRTWRFIPEEKK